MIAARKAKTAMIAHMASGEPSEKTARRIEEIMPLPYCKAPMSAAAEPVRSSGTLESAAALEQAAMMPFVLKKKNIGTTMPHLPPKPLRPSARTTREKMKAMLVAVLRSG